MTPACPRHGATSMTEMLTVGAPGWYTCTVGAPGPPCGYSAFEKETAMLHSNTQPMARWIVTCECGFSHESHALGSAEAIDEVRLMHDPAHADRLSLRPGAVQVTPDGDHARLARLEQLVDTMADMVTRVDAAQADARLRVLEDGMQKLDATMARLMDATNALVGHFEKMEQGAK